MNAHLWDLSDRGRIRAYGEDRKRLLHAMTTNHVEGLQTGQGTYAFFLNAQGRVLSDVLLFCFEDHLLLDVEAGAREKILQHLDRFIIADDVALEDATGATVELAVEGQDADGLAARLGIAVPAQSYSFVPCAAGFACRASASGEPGFRLLLPVEEKDRWVRELIAGGASMSHAEELEAIRIRNGIPRFGIDITEAQIAQETMQMHALHFSKGCYLGQEIVERVRARGHLNRHLVHLEILGDEAPPAGAAIMSGDNESGQITSSARLEGRTFALGYARVEHLRMPETLRAAGAPVRVLSGIA